MKHSDFLENVGDLCESMNALSEQGAQQWSPIVEAMIASVCRDHNEIERTLDYLLDLCSHESGTALFRKL
ncbi:MAG: hypothetical protein ACI9DF_005050 [Verrucomicrobiales bacterium]|jgi:uncharacterized protein YlxP (DUF503 family)